MIDLTKELTKYVNFVLNTNKDEFTSEELEQVTELEIGRNDIVNLSYFNNVTKVTVNKFPSITQSELDEIAATLPRISELIIEQQSALTIINLELFFYLNKVSIISCDNLTTIYNINKLSNLKEITMFNNRKLDISNIYEYIKELKYEFKLDIIYYPILINKLIKDNIDISDRFYDYVSFVDCYGIRDVHVKVLKKHKLFELIDNISNVVSLYCLEHDTDLKKFNVLHKWMLDNVVYINESIEENLEYYGVLEAFTFKKAGRLSYARVFQLLLLFAGIDTTIVYSSEALDEIGKFNGMDIIKFLGDGDYAMVRSVIDDKVSYTDIAWNKYTLENNCYNDLKILLVSKEDIMLKHKLAGDGIVEKSVTINPQELKEIEDEVTNTIQDVDYMFKEVNLDDQEVHLSNQMFADNNKEIVELKNKINQEEVGTPLYNSLVEELINMEKVINSYNKILVKYNESQRDIISKYDNYILLNYFGVMSVSNITEDIKNNIELKYSYHVMSQYLFDLLKMYMAINGV